MYEKLVTNRISKGVERRLKRDTDKNGQEESRKAALCTGMESIGVHVFRDNYQDIRKSEKPSLAMRDFCSLWHEPPFSVFQLYQYGKETEELLCPWKGAV